MEEDFPVEPQAWTAGESLQHLPVELEPELWSEFDEPIAEPDPVAAGPAVLQPPAADWMPDAAALAEPGWDSPPVRFPGSGRPVGIGTPRLCGAGPSLSAEPVEAFLPPSQQPQMMAFAFPAASPMRLGLRAADWEIVVRVADAATAPAAEAVESLLPTTAEPQILAWPSPASLPKWQTPVADWLGAGALARAAKSPAAEPVESLLPTTAEPQISAWPAAASLPQLQIPVADWLKATALAGAAASPAAEPVESLLPTTAEPQISAWPSAASLPQLQIPVADWLKATAIAEAVTALAAQPVETFLPPFAEPQIAAWPAIAAVLPRLTVGPASWVLSVDLAGFAASPAAEAVETFLPAAPQPQVANWPVSAVLLPSLSLVAADWEVASDLAEAANGPAAQAVETFLPAAPEPQMASWAIAAAALPHFTLAAAEWELGVSLAEPANAPAAQAVESFLPAPAEPCALPLNPAALRLPELTLAAIEPESVEEFVPPVVIADASETWMPSAPACEVVCDVIPASAAALPAVIELVTPAQLLQAIEPAIRWMGDRRQSASAEPVISFITPHLEMALPVGFPVTAKVTGVLQKTAIQRGQNLAGVAVERYPEVVEPPKAEAPTIAAAYRQSGSEGAALQLPTFTVQHTTGNRDASFQPGAPSVVEPATAGMNPGSVTPQLGRTVPVQSPQSPAALLRCGLPMANPRGTVLICQRTPMPPVKSLQSIATEIAVLGPKFVVRPIFERIEEAAPAPKAVEKTPAFAEIFEISKAARKPSSSRRGFFSAGKLIAASLIVGISMWFGAGSVKISRQLLAINNAGSTSTSTMMDSSSPKSDPKQPTGAIAAVRRAVQGRAAVELNDTFRRMEAWGSSATAMPTGWARNSGGSVRAGQLALYAPAQKFADYHFEFFGEIEKKSMGWAVRAKDPQNYYGMKMTVIEPGLRPVVAMVHYAVVAGQKMQRVETPLSIMVHNNEPYHVAVDVKGNKVITSVEGQEVDSWTADAIKVGGVGFFSEAGESARLYWMKVSRNQDWLGRVCAYLSSGSGTNTADLWRDELPHSPTQPSEPTLPTSADVTMAAAEETEEYTEIGPQRARILKIGRTELCRS